MNKSGGVECLAWTWGIATLVGVLTAATLWVLGGWSFMQGAFMGVLVLLILGAILTISMCRAPATPHGQAQGGQTGATAGAGAAAAAAGTTAATAVDTSEADAAREAEAARAAAAAEAEAARQAAAAEAEAEAARKAAEAEAAAATRAADDGAGTGDQADTAGAGGVDYDGDGVVEGASEGTRPEALDGPRGGKADDLKRIKGVGPKMEKLCNSLGFYHFDQIASWTPDEVAWVDANLEGFKGRVTRDEWVDQARLLAAGGETEFSKKVDDGDVY